ncbi:MAG TPA: sn-glycerol-3-phosphate ABC transporter ATP-binding protein UgpC [Solirubrobacteraceae bacterium]|nr:sn-glycerol-3-phosphate ABC transporter ATP-binding protein UgpC [Solirubrobacteraceae bacterium]
MAEITLDGLTKRYDDGTVAVDALNLEIAEGELMILVGPSGCGKSTALRMVAGLEEISDGELRIDGEVVNERPPKARDIAMVFQNYALYPHKTVRDNMGFALKMARVDKAEIRKRVDAAAKVLDLEPYLERKPGQLSGGQRQRVAMGRAIVRDPKAFLMDEPLSNLDAKLRGEMRVEIARLQRDLGTTMLYVTHDQTEAMTLGDRVAVMRHGVLQQVASPAELYDRPGNLFVAGFIGSPPMNLIDGTLRDGGVDTAIGHLPLSQADRRAVTANGPSDGEVVVGVRPEAFSDPSLTEQHREDDIPLDVAVDVVESVGSDVYLHARAGGQKLTARLTPQSTPAVGQPIRLTVRPEALRLFAKGSGEAIH